MDVGFQMATMSLVRALARQGKTVVAAMHDLNLAAGFADRAVLLNGGRVAAEGAVNAVLQSGELERAYGAAFDRITIQGTDRLVLAPQAPPTLHDYRHPPIMPLGNDNP
jgi:iron complex transport system ATP-binding protein